MNSTHSTKTEFTPKAVLITPDAEWSDSNGEHVDPTRVTLLHLDSDDNCGWLFTKEEWESDAEPRIYRRYGEHEGLAEGERVELLPDMWIVKIDERSYWTDPTILDRTSRIFGVYVFDRRRHHHICSVEACYECRFLSSQFEPSRELTEEEDGELAELILDGDRVTDDYSYFAVHDIERMLTHECREGFFPAGRTGGFQITGLVSVITEDAIEEARECHHTNGEF